MPITRYRYRRLPQRPVAAGPRQWPKSLQKPREPTLTEAHWEILWHLRHFYEEHDMAPAMRIFVKSVKTQLGEDKGNSIYLMQLFPGIPAKRACRIAGLPRPTKCL